MGSIAFDTNILIYALEREDAIGNRARELIVNATKKENSIIISSLVFS